MNTILLVNLPRQEAERPPAVIAGLAGICKSAGKDYDVVDFNLEIIKHFSDVEWRELQNYLAYYTAICPSHLIEKFKNLANDVFPRKDYTAIAISLFTFETIRAANLLLPLLRKLYSNSKIIIGGHGAGHNDIDHESVPFYQWAIQANLIDYYILGEAELSFKEFLVNPSKWRNSNTKYIVDNLNDVPFACYDKILPSDYLNTEPLGAYVTGSRGCVRDCTFCDVKHIWTKYRFRTANHLFEEVLYHHLNYDVTLIEFTDNLINGSVTEFKRFNELLVNAQEKYPSLKNLRYRGDFICRPKEQFGEEHFKIMKLAGGTDIVVGIESFSQDVRYHMGKKFTNEDIDFHLYCSGKYGIQNTFLMQVGYPTETQADHDINVLYTKRYQKYALSRIIKLIRWGYTTGILPGSPLDTIYRDSLPLVKEFSDKEVFYYGDYNWINASNLTATFAERIRRRMELHFLSKKLRYNQPRIYDEFNFIYSILGSTFTAKKAFKIEAV